jgi:hypothetical protein
MIEVVRSPVTARIWKRIGDLDARSAAALGVCDFCGSALSPLERQRVIWNSGIAGKLVLADLCSRCAADADRLLDLYGGRGRDAIRVTRDKQVAPATVARARRLGGVLVYLLAALASFALVTLISSLR